MAKEQKTTEKKSTVECTDKNCAIHGHIVTRGREFVGTITKTSAQKTAVVEWERLHFLPKYERYEKRKSRLHVHHPTCMTINVGDTVKIAECRPISKTKNFVIVEIMNEEK